MSDADKPDDPAEQIESPDPDQMIDVTALAFARYRDAPIAIEVFTTEGKRVGIPLNEQMLATFLHEGQRALALIRGNEDPEITEF